ncbi:AraC family transcriptional regulator [Gracilibacillus sp. YIM 98692]|uniref:helix-turn-helix domain-containing protein n=1 Tax=Gracilibacillus sp. YIM 98692 TaxID=2663532 RepID=UPI0013D0CBA2|nr:AraC family transcriptional regulator [Gracilibacillus sp. YIM 98692]
MSYSEWNINQNIVGHFVYDSQFIKAKGLDANNNCHIVLVTRGKIRMSAGGMEHQLTAGDMLISNEVYAYYHDQINSQSYQINVTHFDPICVEKIVPKTIFEDSYFLFNTPTGVKVSWSEREKQEMNAFISSINEERQSEKFGYEVMEKTYLAQLFWRISNRSKELYPYNSPVTSFKENHVQHIKAFINNNYKKELSLDLLAKIIHLNKYYMCHCFKDITGITIQQFLLHRRIREAKKLLLTSNDSIVSISINIGIRNPYYFSRLFKQYVGVSPQFYRTQNSLEKNKSYSS